MPIPATKYIWFNGKLVPWEKATVHVLSHALHYGSSVFEGVRAYETPRGPAIFRLRDHTRRLFDSAKIYRINIPFNEDQLNHAQREVISQNGLARGAYLRPVAFRGYGEIGVVPKIDPPVDVAVAAWEWARYLGAAEDEGVDVCVSSWQRVAPNTIPAMAKAKLKPGEATRASMEALPVANVANNYNHLMEQPTLFYAICFALQFLDPTPHPINIGLAWLYVAIRVVHSLVQATVNVIIIRFTIFIIGSIVLAILTFHAALASGLAWFNWPF